MRKYDLVIIGGGSAGLTAAEFARELGLGVAIIERDRMGGDCTWSGCIPSKTLRKIAAVAYDMRRAEEFGLPGREDVIDLSAVMAKVESVIQKIYDQESPDMLRANGIDVLLGDPRFEDPHTLAVGDDLLQGKHILIATGASPIIPDISGVEEISYLTYERVWSMDTMPETLIVIGAGTTGCEFGQAFSRLGAQVLLVEAQDRILPGVDSQAAELMAETLISEGVEILTNTQVDRVEKSENGLSVFSREHVFRGDALLLSAGRKPNVGGLDLEKAGVDYDHSGIRTGKNMKTSQNHIYAAGDCTGGPQFTHVAAWQAISAVRNAFLPFSENGKIQNPPWTLFTDPEVAQVGISEKEARVEYGGNVNVEMWRFDGLDRAATDSAEEGFVKVIHLPGGKVLGATVVGGRAGELIHEWALALKHGLRVKDIAFTLHSYPTYSLANMQTAAEILAQNYMGGLGGKVIRAVARGSLF